MWLVKLRWVNLRTGSPVPPENTPTLDKTITNHGPFTASGRRGGFDCYLFINRAEAEAFKHRVGEKEGHKSSPRWKPQASLVEVTPEDVAHLDLDPVERKTRTATPQI